MNLNEQISRIQSMMYLNEDTLPQSYEKLKGFTDKLDGGGYL